MSVPKDSSGISSSQGERMHLLEIVQILNSHRKLLIICVVMAVIGSIISHLLYIPAYTATSKIEVIGQRENPLSKVGIGDLSTFANYGQDNTQEIQKHISHLKSTAFYRAAAQALVQHPFYLSLNLTQPDELSLFHKKFWRVRFGGQSFSELKEKQHVDLISKHITWLAAILEDSTTIDTDGIQIITITVKTFDPTTSIILANVMADTFSKITTAQDQNELNEMRKFLQERMKETENKVSLDEQEMVKFKKSNGFMTFEGGEKISAEQLKEVESQIGAANLKMEQNKNLIKYYTNQIYKNSEAILNGKVDSALSDSDPRILSRRLDNLRRQKYLLSSQGFSEKDSKIVEINEAINVIVKNLRSQIGAIDNTLDEELPINTTLTQGKIGELNNSNKIIQTQLAALQNAKDTVVKSLSHLPKIEQEIFSRTEALKLEYELYSSLKKKLQEIDIQRLAVKAPVRVDESSRAAPREKKINLLLRMIFAAFTGTFLGSIAIALLELVNTTIKHGSNIEECDLTILGNIPYVDSKLGKLLKSGEVNTDLLVCDTRPNSVESMAFKYVREQIRVQVNSQGIPIRSITVTGVDRHNGKTFIASNLAVSMARANKKVILMDCDLRNPTVHKYFNLKVGEGLTSILSSDNAKIEDFIIHTKTKGLDIMPAGVDHQNPTELIGSDNFKQLLSHFGSIYDYIILDAPPAVYVADAPIMASISDLVIAVVSYRETKKSALLMAHRKIFQISRKRAYSILNKVPVMAHEYLPYVITGHEEQNKVS